MHCFDQVVCMQVKELDCQIHCSGGKKMKVYNVNQIEFRGAKLILSLSDSITLVQQYF